MSRIIKNDFKSVKEFINDYSLSHLLKDKGFVELISSCHKKYFSYLTLIAEIDDDLNEKESLYFTESVSDVATSFFHLFSGSYKSSKLILRSSIENFIKGFSLLDIPDIDKETRVSNMFMRVKQLPVLEHEFPKNEFAMIHNCYKDLCKDVHSADEINMEKISALNLFPKYSRKELEAVVSIFIKLIQSYITLLCYTKNQKFHKIHYINREIILGGVNRNKRPFINDISLLL